MVFQNMNFISIACSDFKMNHMTYHYTTDRNSPRDSHKDVLHDELLGQNLFRRNGFQVYWREKLFNSFIQSNNKNTRTMSVNMVLGSFILTLN